MTTRWRIPPRQLVGIFADPNLRRGDADLGEHFDGESERLAAIARPVEQEYLAQLATDGVDRVEGGHGLLEDHPDLASADATHRLDREGGDIFSLEQDLAAADAAHGLRQQAHDRQRGHALAAARFPHHAEGAASPHLQAHAVDRGQGSGVRVERGDQVADVEDDVGRGGRGGRGAHCESQRAN